MLILKHIFPQTILENEFSKRHQYFNYAQENPQMLAKQQKQQVPLEVPPQTSQKQYSI